MIALIGLPGVGKTTVGTALALKVGLPFKDLDFEIENYLGFPNGSAAEILKNNEHSFRFAEGKLLARLQYFDGVVATGGGAVYYEESRKILKYCNAIYLKQDLDIIKDIIDLSNRFVKDVEILSLRLPLYKESCGFTIEVGSKTVDEIVDEIMDLMRI